MISSKLEGLKFLKKKVNLLNSLVPNFIDEFAHKVNFDKKKFIKKIKKNFKRDIIIRSSAHNEDTINFSNAGAYVSEIVLRNDFKKLDLKLDNVLKYLKSKKDKIIVQEFINRVDLSGVLFTREINEAKPYFVINYDKSKRTDLITAGKLNPSIKCLYIYKNTNKIPKKFSELISITKYLQKKLANRDLDIEFCLKGNKLFIFQCRYLKKVKQNNVNFNIPLNNLYKKIKKISSNPFISGNKTIFSNMSDWNPAEMIGTKPKSLSLSLYKSLITDSIWCLQRKNYGYQNLFPNKLMYNFLGSPYIDLKTDLNSFLPKDLNKNLSDKVINFCINKLKNNKNLHDKIEFELIETFYNFDTKKKLSLFLNKKEIKDYSKKLLKLTNNIVTNRALLKKDISKINSLRDKVDIINSKKISEIQKIYFVHEIAKTYGSLPFAGIARCAFVATSFLRYFKGQNIISNFEYQNFFKNLNITKNRKEINSKKQFLKDYGHMRPSNYSISTLNYKENYKKYFGEKLIFREKQKNRNFYLSAKQKIEINTLLKKYRYNFKTDKLFKFIKESIYYREKAKIDFIYAVDNIFKNLIKLGKEIKIHRNKLEYLDIGVILEAYENLGFDKLKETINNNIFENRQNYRKYKNIVLPEVITNENDIYSFYKENSIGNFITEQELNSKIISYSNRLDLKKIINKVVCIENADPGFDFLFNYKIKGLVTKYGGANSHMSIRCLENNVPACIGVGENFYDNLNYEKKIYMNCKKNIIKQLV